MSVLLQRHRKLLPSLLVFAFSFLYSLWAIIHELAHYFACQSYGKFSSWGFIYYLIPRISCQGQLNSSEKFIYYMSPYIFGLIVIAVVAISSSQVRYLNEKLRLFLKLLTYAIVIDVPVNFIYTSNIISDFKAVQLYTNSFYYFLSLLIAITTCLVGVYLARSDFTKFRSWLSNAT